MRATTRQTGDRTPHATHSRENLATIRAAINKARRISTLCEWKIVTALFIADSQVPAGLAPFIPVRQNPAPPGAELREEMSEFVSQRAIDFIGVMNQLRI